MGYEWAYRITYDGNCTSAAILKDMDYNLADTVYKEKVPSTAVQSCGNYSIQNNESQRGMNNAMYEL